MGHPYYPVDAHILNYAANEDPIFVVILHFSLGLSVVLGLTYIFVRLVRPSISGAELLTILWFTLSGALHCIFEGYFVTHHNTLAQSQDILAQLWKEYALSDSRYLSTDTFVLCIETITVFVWGPLCLLVAYSIAYKHPLRDVLQVIACVAHIYGDVLYYATSLFDHYAKGIPYSRPEAIYFWVYYFLMNFIWIVVPAHLLLGSCMRIHAAFIALDQLEREQKST